MARIDLVDAAPQGEKQGLFETATRRSDTRFRVDRLDRRASVRFRAQYTLRVS